MTNLRQLDIGSRIKMEQIHSLASLTRLRAPLLSAYGLEQPPRFSRLCELEMPTALINSWISSLEHLTKLKLNRNGGADVRAPRTFLLHGSRLTELQQFSPILKLTQLEHLDWKSVTMESPYTLESQIATKLPNLRVFKGLQNAFLGLKMPFLRKIDLTHTDHAEWHLFLEACEADPTVLPNLEHMSTKTLSAP
jgi:hypothetical protein